MADQPEKQKIDFKKLAADVGKAASTAGESVGKAAVAVTDKTKELSTKPRQRSWGLSIKTVMVRSILKM